MTPTAATEDAESKMSPEELSEFFNRGVSSDIEHAPSKEVDTESQIALLRLATAQLEDKSLKDATVRKRFTQEIGIGSRSPSWRAPIGKSGLLGYFLDTLPEVEKSMQSTPDKTTSASIQDTFRIIGNCCADTDENRDLLVKSGHLKDIIAFTAFDDLLDFVIPTLYNILVDYEPAQLQAIECSLSTALLHILESRRHDHSASFSLIPQILSLLVAHDQEVQHCPSSALRVLFRTAVRKEDPVSLEDFGVFLSIALSYLSTEKNHDEMLSNIPILLSAFALCYERPDIASEPDEENFARLEAVRTAFTQVLADISAHPDFVPADRKNFFSSPSLLTLRRWLEESSSPEDMQIAACLILGNVARTDDMSKILVQDVKIHAALTQILERPRQNTSACLKLTHAVLGLAKNLAILISNKPALSTLLLPTILPALWATDAADDENSPRQLEQQVQLSAISLTRLLLTSCLDNVLLFCTPKATHPTNLEALLFLFHRAKVEAIKMEAARALLAICRSLYATPIPHDDIFGETPSPQNDVDAIRAMIETEDLAVPISYLLTQPRFPALRSEALLVTALLARSQAGAGFAVAVLAVPDVASLLDNMIGGDSTESGDKQALAPDSGDDSSAMPKSPTSKEAKDDGGVVVKALEDFSIEPKAASGNAKSEEAWGQANRNNALCLLAALLQDHEEMLGEDQKERMERLVAVGAKAM